MYTVLDNVFYRLLYKVIHKVFYKVYLGGFFVRYSTITMCSIGERYAMRYMWGIL